MGRENEKDSKRTKSGSNKKTTSRQSAFIIDPGRRTNYKSVIDLIKRNFKGVQTSAMPSQLDPMLATLTEGPFTHKDWLFEIKWDGYRSIAYLNNGEVQIKSRNNLPFNSSYPEVYEALKAWPLNAVVDGEIAVLNHEGKADFGALQNWKRIKAGSIVYYLFDILWLDGISLLEQ